MADRRKKVIGAGSGCGESSRGGQNGHGRQSSRSGQMDRRMLALHIVLSILLGAALYIACYGTALLDPGYTAYPLSEGGDLAQHFVGWEAFRAAKWSFPQFGLFDTLSWPAKTSIVFTDSVPLFAIFFKLLSPLLPENFQYLGYWGMFGFVMTSVLSGILLRRYFFPAGPADREFPPVMPAGQVSGMLLCLCAQVFFVTAPVALLRLYIHEALGAGQWLIVLALIPIACYEERYSKRSRALLFWCLLGALTPYVHLYFAPMCLTVMVGFCLLDLLRRLRPSGSRHPLRRFLCLFVSELLYPLVFLAGMLISLWFLGALQSGAGEEVWGLGYFSMNLNALWNSQGYARFLNFPTATDGQYEGFCYMGLGALVLLAVMLVLAIAARVRARSDAGTAGDSGKVNGKSGASGWPLFWAVIVILAVGTILAASPTVTLNGKTLFTIPYPETVRKLLAVFRSSGRFGWVLVYTLMWVALSAGSGQFFPALRAMAIVLCLGLQLWDISWGFTFGPRIVPKDRTYSERIEGPVWSELENAGTERILLLSQPDDGTLYSLGHYAAHHHMKINRYPTVHALGQFEAGGHALTALDDQRRGSVFLANDTDVQALAAAGVNIYRLEDGWYLGIAAGETDTGEDSPAAALVDPATVAARTYTFDGASPFYVVDGEDRDGVRILSPGGVCGGPYQTLYRGKYEVTVEGTALADVTFEIYSNRNGGRHYAWTDREDQDGRIVMTFDIPESMPDYELIFSNQGSGTAEIRRIEVKAVS